MSRSYPERKPFDPKAFSLLISVEGRQPIEVSIPIEREVQTLDGPELKTEYLKRTTQWAIDKYTTRFASKAELLENIRENNLADIGDISDENVSISMFYNDYDHDSICTEVAYSDSFDLTNILDQCQYNAGSGELYGDYAEVFIENFKRYMIEKCCIHGDAYQYWKYWKEYQGQCFYNSKLLMGLLLQQDKDEYEKGIYHLNQKPFEKEFNEYYNVRAHCLINQDDLQAQFDLEREEKKGHPIDAEDVKDLNEAREEARRHHEKRPIDEIHHECLGDKMIAYPKENMTYDESEYIQDPEEEMERLNYYYDDEETKPLNMEYEDEEPVITKAYYDSRGQGIIPFDGVDAQASEVISYDKDGNTLLFNPEETHKKR